MTETVHVITDLGPTDGPGLIVPAELLGWDPYAARRRRAQWSWSQQLDDWAASYVANPPDMPTRHTNQPCNPTPNL